MPAPAHTGQRQRDFEWACRRAVPSDRHGKRVTHRIVAGVHVDLGVEHVVRTGQFSRELDFDRADLLVFALEPPAWRHVNRQDLALQHAQRLLLDELFDVLAQNECVVFDEGPSC